MLWAKYLSPTGSGVSQRRSLRSSKNIAPGSTCGGPLSQSWCPSAGAVWLIWMSFQLTQLLYWGSWSHCCDLNRQSSWEWEMIPPSHDDRLLCVDIKILKAMQQMQGGPRPGLNFLAHILDKVRPNFCPTHPQKRSLDSPLFQASPPELSDQKMIFLDYILFYFIYFL